MYGFFLSKVLWECHIIDSFVMARVSEFREQFFGLHPINLLLLFQKIAIFEVKTIYYLRGSAEEMSVCPDQPQPIVCRRSC